MKKIGLLLAAALICGGLTGCGNDSQSKNSNKDSAKISSLKAENSSLKAKKNSHHKAKKSKTSSSTNTKEASNQAENGTKQSTSSRENSKNQSPIKNKQASSSQRNVPSASQHQSVAQNTQTQSNSSAPRTVNGGTYYSHSDSNYYNVDGDIGWRTPNYVPRDMSEDHFVNID